MTINEPVVPIPLTQLQSWANHLTERPGIWIGDEMRALLPKPPPRLVAVDLNDYVVRAKATGFTPADQPDLLTLIDEAIDKWFDSFEGYRDDLKSHIRAALGVTE